MSQIDLSLIVPAYNEENRLRKTLPLIKAYFDEFDGDYEVIIVDDGSKDQTRVLVEDYKEQNPEFCLYLNEKRENMGKGYSVKEGFNQSRYPWILFSDADLSTPLREIEQFQKYTDSYDLIIASRDLPGSQVTEQPIYRKAMGALFSFFSFLITNLRIRDTQCGFKMFSRKTGEVIFPKQTIYGFGFDVELLYIAKKYGFRIKELPVEWVNDPDSKINSFKDSVRMVGDLVRVRYNDWFKNAY